MYGYAGRWYRIGTAVYGRVKGGKMPPFHTKQNHPQTALLKGQPREIVWQIILPVRVDLCILELESQLGSKFFFSSFKTITKIKINIFNTKPSWKLLQI